MDKETESVVRRTGLIGGITILSRALGVIRDAACAAFFGAGPVWDAFSFAFRVPNLFRRLFGEGALSAAFVPALTEYLELRSPEESERLTGRVAGALTVVLTALVLLGEVLVFGATVLFRLTPRWHLALSLTAVLLPYAVLICLTALAGATLHSLKHFAAPALAPVVLNVCWIVAVTGLAPLVTPDPRGRIFILAAAILVAGLLQLYLQLAALRRKGFRWRPRFDLLHREVAAVAGAMVPVALGLAAFQLNVLLDGVIAISLAGPPEEGFRLLGVGLSYPMRVGANSVLYFGNRLMQFPLGVFGIALGTAVFPTLSGQAARRDFEAFGRSVVQGLRLVLFIGVPAGVGLIVLRRPVIQLIFERRAFTPAMTARTARVLLFYSLGIWAYCALHVLTRAFYSLKLPSVPAKVAGAMVALNLALNLTLVWPLQEAGLALSTAACAALQVCILYALLARRVSLEGMGKLLVTALKTAASTAAMALAAWKTLEVLPPDRPGLVFQLLRALLPALAGVVTYFAAATLLRTEQMGILLGALRSRHGKREEGEV